MKESFRFVSAIFWQIVFQILIKVMLNFIRMAICFLNLSLKNLQLNRKPKTTAKMCVIVHSAVPYRPLLQKDTGLTEWSVHTTIKLMAASWKSCIIDYFLDKLIVCSHLVWLSTKSSAQHHECISRHVHWLVAAPATWFVKGKGSLYISISNNHMNWSSTVFVTKQNVNCFALCKTQSSTHLHQTTMHGPEMTGAMYCQCAFNCSYFTRSTIHVQISSTHIFLFPIWLCQCALTVLRLPPAWGKV